jgi:elongation factor P--beta-lysine ligase
MTETAPVTGGFVELEASDDAGSRVQAGSQELLVTVVGRAPQSSGCAIGLDRLELRRK